MDNIREIESNYVLKHFKICRKRKFRKRLIAFFAIVFFFLLSICFYFVKVSNPLISSYAEMKLSQILSKGENEAILKNSNFSYNDIIKITYDSSNTISSIVADSNFIVKLSNSLALDTQKNIDLYSQIGLNIPFGTLTGIGIFIGKGRNINFSIQPIGEVICSFHTTFTSAGINQTSHKIFVTIESQAGALLPFKMQRVRKQIDYLISECVIIGKVPQVYLGITSLKDLSK